MQIWLGHVFYDKSFLSKQFNNIENSLKIKYLTKSLNIAKKWLALAILTVPSSYVFPKYVGKLKSKLFSRQVTAVEI